MPQGRTGGTDPSPRAVPAPYPLFPAGTAPPLGLQATALCPRGKGRGPGPGPPAPRCRARRQTPLHPRAAMAVTAAIVPPAAVGPRSAPWAMQSGMAARSAGCEGGLQLPSGRPPWHRPAPPAGSGPSEPPLIPGVRKRGVGSDSCLKRLRWLRSPKRVLCGFLLGAR